MPRFEGKVAIITGAASGIGLATAHRLGSEGARIVLADIASEAADRISEIIHVGAPEAIAIACDVGREEHIDRAVDQTLQRFGRLDVVVNNAAIMIFQPIAKLEVADWKHLLGVNLIGAARFLRAAFRTMQPGGAVVNVSSIHAERTSSLLAAYAASKAGMLALTRAAAIEGRELGIRVNAVEPGAIDTPLLWSNPNVKSGAETIAAPDIGKPEEVAAAIAFLASDEASFVTGASLRVDRGRLAHL